MAADAEAELEAEEAQHMRHKIAFAILAAVLIACGVLFASVALKGEEGDALPAINISGEAVYTVVLDVAIPERRAEAEQLLAEAEIQDLVQGRELFVYDLPDGGIAMCAGRFAASDDPSARALLKRVREFRLGSRSPFVSADIRACPPQESN